MQALIQQLVKEVGLTEEQAKLAIQTVANYVKEQFPMVSGAVDQIFPKG